MRTRTAFVALPTSRRSTGMTAALGAQRQHLCEAVGDFVS